MCNVAAGDRVTERHACRQAELVDEMPELDAVRSLRIGE